MKTYKWNQNTQTHEPNAPPEGAVTIAELDDEVNCAECGRPMVYGDGYTSLTIYTVCESCYAEE